MDIMFFSWLWSKKSDASSATDVVSRPTVHYLESIDSWVNNSEESTEKLFKVKVKEIILKCIENRRRQLDLSSWFLESIPPLEGVSHIEELILSDNKLKAFRQEHVDGLYKLKSINLCNNKIEIIEDINLSKFKSLESIVFDCNCIKTIKNVCARNLSQFFCFSAKVNPLKCIKNVDFSNCPILQTFDIDCSRVYLDLIADLNFTNCHSLESFDLIVPKVSEVNGLIFKGCYNLEGINIRHVQLKKISNLIVKNCPNLNLLLLGNNRLKELSKVKILNCPRLSAICFGGNQLEDLSELEISECPSLRWLDFNFNSLVEFNCRMPGMQHPFEINLQNNCFSMESVSMLNSRQNMPDYSGPVYRLSIEEGSWGAFQHYTLHEVLVKWGRSAQHPAWTSLMVSIGEGAALNRSLSFFLSRLYNECPRNADYRKTIPENIQAHVDALLDGFESLYKSSEIRGAILYITREYTSSCSDKIAVGLILLSLRLRLELARKGANDMQVKQFTSAINWIKYVSDFIQNVREYRVVFDEKCQMFFDLSCIAKDTVKHGLYEVGVDRMSQEERQDVILKKRTEGHAIRVFNIGDDVEDVLLLLNTLKKAEIVEIDHVEMKFRACATLKTEQLKQAAIKYLLKKNPSNQSSGVE